MQHRKGYYYGRKIRNLKCAADYLAFFKSIPDAAWDGDGFLGFDACCAHGHLGNAYAWSCKDLPSALDNLAEFERRVLGRSLFSSTMGRHGAQCKTHTVQQYTKLVLLGY